MTIKIILIDDHTLFRSGIKALKENIIRALNKEKWKEQQHLKEMQGKEIVRFM